MPKNIAFEFQFTGDLVDAQKTLELMIVNYIMEPEDAMAKAEEIAHKISANAPLPIAAIKKASTKGADMGLKERVKFAGRTERSAGECGGQRRRLGIRREAHAGVEGAVTVTGNT